MNDVLFEPAPGFDQPIAVLKHCHDKIRKQIKTLERLLDHLPNKGATLEAQQAASAVLHYFNAAAHFHHADEEQDLLPMLRRIAGAQDLAILNDLQPQILTDHHKMEALWQELAQQLEAIASGKSSHLAASVVQAFADLYSMHMLMEEGNLAPMALRLFDPAMMQQLGNAMQQRRNQPPSPSSVTSSATGASPTLTLDLSDLRQDYKQASLSRNDVAADPMQQFQTWFDEARKAKVQEPNAMSLSTVAASGRPSSRIVLIKQCDPRGFIFFTNYDSRKGQDLAHNQFGALLFFWSELERQIRIEGRIEKISLAESESYFHGRPLGSRQSALASHQSQPIANRRAMEAQLAAVCEQFGEHPPRPENWGGYRLIPDMLEFWQGRASRFHDRIVYQRDAADSWQIMRLQP